MDIDEIRRNNIKALEAVHGAELYKRAGMTPSQFYNLRNGAKDSTTGKPRGMRKETAWRIEDAAGVARGYLDVPHDASEPGPTMFIASDNTAAWPFVRVTHSQWNQLPNSIKNTIETQILALVTEASIESKRKSA